MGKRAVLGYSNYFMPGIKGPGPNRSTYLDERSFTINNVHCLNFEYAYKERKQVCLSAQYMRTGVAYDRGAHDGFLDAASSYEYPFPEGARYGGNYSKPALLTSFNIAIGMKAFKTGYIAPVGRYYKAEMLFMFEKLRYDNEHFMKPVDDEPQNDTLYTLGTGEYSYRNFALTYTIGKQRVLWDKIVFDYGIRLALTPAMNIVSMASIGDHVNSVEIYYRRYSHSRVAHQQFVNIHVGIGFLAF